MKKNEIPELLLSMYTGNSSLQLAYYDYLSLTYPLTIDLLDSYRYCWNYNLLCLNNSIDQEFNSIINSTKNVFYGEYGKYDRKISDFHTELWRETIDITYNLLPIIKNRDFGKIESVHEKISDKHLLNSLKNFQDLIKYILNDLIQKGLLSFTHQDYELLLSFCNDFQEWLPLDESFIINNKHIINWYLLSSNKEILWTDNLLITYSDKVNWAEISRYNNFNRNQLLKYSDLIIWKELIKNAM